MVGFNSAIYREGMHACACETHIGCQLTEHKHNTTEERKILENGNNKNQPKSVYYQ